MPRPLPTYPVQLTLEREVHLQQLSTWYTAPFAEVQRARILLLAHQQPPWRHAEIARQGAAVSIRSSTGDNAGCQPTACVRHRGLVPAVPSRRSSRPRVPRWPVVRHAPTANPGRAGRGSNWPRAPSHSRSWSLSRQGRAVPGGARTRSNPGALTLGSTRLRRTLWTRPRRCSISTNTPTRWQRRRKRWCAVISRPPSKPVSGLGRPRQRRQGPPVHVAER